MGLIGGFDPAGKPKLRSLNCNFKKGKEQSFKRGLLTWSPNHTKAHTDLPHFLVLLLLPLLPLLLQLRSLLLVHQRLVSLRQEGKVKFPVAPLGSSAVARVIGAMLIAAVHVALIIHFAHVDSGEGAEELQLSGM